MLFMSFLVSFPFEVFYSQTWNWRSPQEDEVQHSLFAAEMQPSYEIGLDVSRWRAGLRYFSFSESDWREHDAMTYLEMKLCKRFPLFWSLEATPSLSLGYSALKLLGQASHGPVYGYGLDIGWRPRSFVAKALISGRYRIFSPDIPGPIHHQWELGLGFEFPVWQHQ